MFYYAYIDENNIVQAVYSMPSAITGANFIQIESDDQSLVGKRYNPETGLFEEVVYYYYYAKLNDRDIVIEVLTVENTPFAEAPDLIPIASEDTTLINKTYNRETQQFEDTPISVLAKHSTDEINVGNEDKWLTTELAEMYADIVNLETELNAKIDEKADENHAHTDYAATNHTHTGFAAESHTHSTSDVTGLDDTLTEIGDDISALATAVQGKAATEHTHSNYAETTHNHDTAYAGINHNHDTDYAAAAHSHTATDISGLNVYSRTETDAKLNTKLNASAYTAADILAKLKEVDGQNSGLDADLLDGHNSDYFATATQLAGKANASHAHSEYATAESVTELAETVSGKAAASHNHEIANVNGLSNALAGKAAASHTHEIANVTGLETALSGKAATSHTHTLDAISETTNKKIMTAAERTKLNGIAANANNYTHPASHPVSMIEGLETALAGKAAATHSHAQSDITGLADALAGKASSSHTHTAAAVGAAAANHNHSSLYVPKSLQMTADNGDVELSWSGKNIVNEFKALASGMTTVYSPAGATNNPNSSESFRFMIHKTGSANFGWIMAFGSQGSVYTGYIDSGTWKGWKTIWEYAPTPLWTGGYYMTAGHTVTPSKKLSECRNGWILMWSDFDPGEQANNTDFYATVICKKAYAGQNWQGGEWYCDVPRYSAGTATDSESRVIKVLKIYDAKIVGTANNDAAPRNDVVLRAIYEF